MGETGWWLTWGIIALGVVLLWMWHVSGRGRND